MFKTERVLSLVSAIVGIVMFVIMLIVGLIVGAVGAMGVSYGVGGGGLVAMSVIAVILSLVSFILGFIGSSKLAKGDKGGGVMTLVAGGLALISCIVGFAAAFGFLLIPCIALYLTAGIMVLAKKPVAAPAAE